MNKEELLDYLLSCLNDAAASVEEQIAEVYYKKIRDKFVFSVEISDRNLWELLKKVGKAFRLIPNNAQKGRLQDQRLTGECKQRWLDAGMEEYRTKMVTILCMTTTARCMSSLSLLFRRRKIS